MGWLFPESDCKQCEQHAELHAQEGLFTMRPCKQCEQHAATRCGKKPAPTT